MNCNPTDHEHMSCARDDLRRRYGIPADAFVFASFGNSHPQTDFETLMRAGIALLESFPHMPIHFLLNASISTPAEQRSLDILVRMSWDRSLRSRFHVFTGHPCLPELLALSDAYVAATQKPTNSTLLRAAMARGLPVIASASGAHLEVITDPRCGLLFPPLDGTALQSSLQSLLQNPRLCSGFGTAAKEHALASFCITQGSARIPKQRESIQIPAADVSLIMRASRPDTAISALTSACATFPEYRECIIAVSPTMPEKTTDALGRVPRTRLIGGTARRENAGDIHYHLLDECRGEWIANIDDDDLWTNAPSLCGIAKDIGLLYGPCLHINMFRRPADPRFIVLERGHAIETPAEANGVPGSFWIMRTAAWRAISPDLTDRSFNFSDWRMFSQLIRKGWRAVRFPQTFGVMRRFRYDFPLTEHWNSAVHAPAKDTANTAVHS